MASGLLKNHQLIHDHHPIIDDTATHLSPINVRLPPRKY